MLGMGGGTRKKGRPRARWLDDIKAITNCTLTELYGSATDRNAWRKMVMVITRSRTRLMGQGDGTLFHEYCLGKVKVKSSPGSMR